MNLQLSRWNPFRFLRGHGHGGAPRSAEGDGDGQGRPSWLESREARWRNAPGDPLNVMRDLLPVPGLERWFGDYSPTVFEPRIDVVDEGDALRITAELPGMERSEIEVLMEDGLLTLRGEKKLESEKEEQGCYRLERAYGRFERAIMLPDGVDLEHADARFENGVLTLRLPKTGAKADQRRIEVK